MLTCSRQGVPKTAMVFDDDVDIWNDSEIQKRGVPLHACARHLYHSRL